jgi:hypothetical protein
MPGVREGWRQAGLDSKRVAKREQRSGKSIKDYKALIATSIPSLSQCL